MTRRGLFIGIDDYPAELGTLSSCVRDAQAMQAACIELGLLDAAQTTLMTSPPQGTQSDTLSDAQLGTPLGTPLGNLLPTRAAILDWLLPLYDADRPIDRLIVYFSGHGLSLRLGREADELRTVFAPAGLRSLKNSGGELIDFDELIGRFRRRGARDQVWIIDACRNSVETRLNVATIGWDAPAPNDPREAMDNAQAAIFAVAPLAKAAAEKNGHGRLTRHLLDGLRGKGGASWGAAADYDEASGGWIISCASLVRYARRRIGETYPEGDWRRDYELPQLRVGETLPQPLRAIGNIDDRPVRLTVIPPDAATHLRVEISARRRVLAAWPPLAVGQPAPLAPEVYRLTASRLDESFAPLTPPLLQGAIDVRETDHVELRLPPPTGGQESATVRQVGPLMSFTPGREFTIDHAIALGETRDALSVTGADLVRYAAHSRPAESPLGNRVLQGSGSRDRVSVVVRAKNPASSIPLAHVNEGYERRDASREALIEVEPGVWRFDLGIGTKLVSSSTFDFKAGGNYAISLAPEVYRLTASRLDDACAPVPQPLVLGAIEVQEIDRIKLRQPPPAGGQAVQAGPQTSFTLGREFTSAFGKPFEDLSGTATDLLHDTAHFGPAEPQVRKRVLKGAGGRGRASVVVRAKDPASSIVLARLSGGSERREVISEAPVDVAPGIWRLDLRIGAELISSSTFDFEAGGHYAISPRISVTPAIAALLRVEAWRTGDGQAPFAVSLGEDTGPMQGALLATLLPLAALRLFDSARELPAALAPGVIPGLTKKRALRNLDEDTSVVALAFEGGWPAAARKSMVETLVAQAKGRLLWADPDRRVALISLPAPAAAGDRILRLHGLGTLHVPVPSARGCCAIVALTLWPGRIPEAALALICVPEAMAQAANSARARAVLTRLLQAGGEGGRSGIGWALSAQTANDPILSALAWWWGRRRASSPDDAKAAQAAAQPALAGRFGGLPDARVIKALEDANPDVGLDALLDDSGFGMPALADSIATLARRAFVRGLADHWSAARFQRLGDAAFNVIFDPGEDQ
jgi:hypothetical protein